MSKFNSETCGYMHKLQNFSKKDEQDKKGRKEEYKKVYLIGLHVELTSCQISQNSCGSRMNLS